MSKIIVEHATKRPNTRLSIFVDEVKVGDLSHRLPLEVDVPPGEHLLQVSLSKKKIEGVGQAFHVGEDETKKIKTSLTMKQLFAASWHFYFLMAGVMAVVLVAGRLVSGGMVRQEHVILACMILPIAVPAYFIVQAKRAKNPRDFVQIEVVE